MAAIHNITQSQGLILFFLMGDLFFYRRMDIKDLFVFSVTEKNVLKGLKKIDRIGFKGILFVFL